MAGSPCSRAACQAWIMPRSVRCACTGQTAPVTSAISCRHRSNRDMLEDDQVNGQGPQSGPDGQGGIRDTRRPGRDMHPAAGAPGLVQVVLHPLRRRRRDLLLLIRPGDPQVSGIRQVADAGSAALGMVILGPVRDLPRHGRPGLPGCFPRFFFSARSAARRCFRGGFLPGRSADDGGIEEFPLFRDPARPAVSSCSRRSATTASSVAIFSACAAISCACSPISASRGSADGSPGGASVTARNHPGNHAHPPRQHHARRWNVTHLSCPGEGGQRTASELQFAR
jgi:hypothetical protein